MNYKSGETATKGDLVRGPGTTVGHEIQGRLSVLNQDGTAVVNCMGCAQPGVGSLDVLLEQILVSDFSLIVRPGIVPF